MSIRKAESTSLELMEASRKQDLEFFLPLLQSISQPMTLALVSPWGSGKSTFLELLCERLKRDSYEVISINAWESDYANDPMSVIIEAMTTQLDLSPDNTALPSTSKALLKGILKTAAPIFLRAGFDEIRENFKDDDTLFGATADVTEKLLEQQIHAIGETRAGIQEMKTALSSFAESLPNKRLFIFIDELDRCRPQYAISFLEHIKHFFNIPGITFLIAIDKKQLNNDIKYLYGQDVDPDRYLRKIIDMELQLPLLNVKEFITITAESMGWNALSEVIISRHEEQTPLFDEIKIYTGIVTRIYGLHLRDIQHLLSKLYFLYTTTQGCHLRPSLTVILMAASMTGNLHQENDQISAKERERLRGELITKVRQLNLKDINWYIDKHKPTIICALAYLLYPDQAFMADALRLFEDKSLNQDDIDAYSKRVLDEAPCILKNITTSTQYL